MGGGGGGSDEWRTPFLAGNSLTLTFRVGGPRDEDTTRMNHRAPRQESMLTQSKMTEPTINHDD